MKVSPGGPEAIAPQIQPEWEQIMCGTDVDEALGSLPLNQPWPLQGSE